MSVKSSSQFLESVSLEDMLVISSIAVVLPSFLEGFSIEIIMGYKSIHHFIEGKLSIPVQVITSNEQFNLILIWTDVKSLQSDL
jgi:hypothetical protein